MKGWEIIPVQLLPVFIPCEIRKSAGSIEPKVNVNAILTPEKIHLTIFYQS